MISIDRILRRMADWKQHLTITTLRASGIRIQSQTIYGNNCNVHLCSMIYPVLSDLNHIILVNNYKQPMNFAGQVTLQYSCWKIPRTKDPGGLQSMGLQRVRHD